MRSPTVSSLLRMVSVSFFMTLLSCVHCWRVFLLGLLMLHAC